MFEVKLQVRYRGVTCRMHCYIACNKARAIFFFTNYVLVKKLLSLTNWLVAKINWFNMLINNIITKESNIWLKLILMQHICKQEQTQVLITKQRIIKRKISVLFLLETCYLTFKCWQNITNTLINNSRHEEWKKNWARLALSKKFFLKKNIII